MFLKRLLVALAACLTTLEPVPTARTADADSALPADLAFVPADADNVVSLRVAKLWAGDSIRSFREMADRKKQASISGEFGFLPAEVERLTVFQRGQDTVVLVATAKPTDRKKVLTVLAPVATRRLVAGKPCYRNEEEWRGVAFLTDRVVAIGPVDAVEALARSTPAKTGSQAETLRLAAKHDLVVGMTSRGEDGLATLKKGLPKLLRDAAPLLGAKFAALTADERAGTPPGLRVKAAFRFASGPAAEGGAKAAAVLLRAAVKGLGEMEADWKKNGPDASQGFEGVSVALTELLKELRTSRAEVANGTEVRFRLGLKARDVGTIVFTRCMVNVWSRRDPPEGDPHLERLAKAVLAYHKDKGHLPPHALLAKDGKTPLLSWRVLVLPYLGEEGKKLYRRFRLDEPWDGEHNIRLVRRMPRVFAGDDETNVATTHYQVLAGKGTLFDGPQGRPLADATDGAANTVLIAQGYHRVPWTKPQDLAYAADKPLPPIGTPLTPFQGVPLAFADGRVRTHAAPGMSRQDAATGRMVWQPTKGFDEALLRALITRAGGEKVHRDAARPLPVWPKDPSPSAKPTLKGSLQTLPAPSKKKQDDPIERKPSKTRLNEPSGRPGKAATSLAGSPDGSAAGQVKATDLEKIQGTWRVVRTEAQGEVRTNYGANGKWPRWTFEGTVWINKAAGSKTWKRTFRLDPEQSPKRFEFEEDGSASGLPGIVQVRGIYKMKGKQLWIRLGEPAGGLPRDFRTAPADGTGVYVLEREEPAAPPSAPKGNSCHEK